MSTTCDICLGWLQSPVVLPCKHSYCHGCITQWVQQGQPKCPTCLASLLGVALTVDDELHRKVSKYCDAARGSSIPKVDASCILFAKPKIILGRGAAGVVKKARYADTDVAVKTVDLCRENIEAASKELRHGSRVSHPNLVTFLAYCEDQEEGEIHFVMELGKEDLAKKMLERGRLTDAEVIEVGIQICAGLHAMTKVGLSHGDVKPDNIIVFESPDRYKLCDFHLASTMKSTKQMGGTFLYVAPEVLLHGQGNSAESDMYSFGHVLLQAATGTVPYGGMTLAQVSVAKSTQHTVPETVTSGLGTLIERCLQQNPKQRPTASECVVYLRSLVPVALPKKASMMDMQRRVVSMYERHDPTGTTAQLDAVMAKHAGKEEALLETLVRRYGPEPGPGAPEMSTTRKVCCYYLQGTCMRTAANCKYTHDDQGQPCQYSVACRLKHSTRIPPPQCFYLRVAESAKSQTVINIISVTDFQYCMIFVNTEQSYNTLNESLLQTKFPSVAIHGGMPAVQREALLSTVTKILVTNDDDDRIDVSLVGLVIHYDVPSAAQYIRRVGKDITVTLVSTEQDMFRLKDLQSQQNKTIRETEGPPPAAPVPMHIVQCGVCNTHNKVPQSLEVFPCGKCGEPNRVVRDVPVVAPPNKTPMTDKQRRVVAMYERYDRLDPAQLDAVMAKHAGKEEALLETLVRRYGPEPGAHGPPSAREAVNMQVATLQKEEKKGGFGIAVSAALGTVSLLACSAGATVMTATPVAIAGLASSLGLVSGYNTGLYGAAALSHSLATLGGGSIASGGGGMAAGKVVMASVATGGMVAVVVGSIGLVCCSSYLIYRTYNWIKSPHSKTNKVRALIEEEGIQQGKPSGTLPQWQEAFKEFAGAEFVNMKDAIDFSLRALPHLRADQRPGALKDRQRAFEKAEVALMRGDFFHPDVPYCVMRDIGIDIIRQEKAALSTK